MTAPRVIIADDHEVVRQGLRWIVEDGAGLTVVAEAADGIEAERLAREIPAELLILDLTLPKKDGTEVLVSLRSSGVSLPILFYSMHPAYRYADDARRNGAQGFVSKSATSSELLRAIQRILDGGTCFPRRLSSSAYQVGPFASLSQREIEVMRGLLRGDTLEHIALSLGIGAKSVTTYRRRLLDKLGVHSNVELAALAARHQIV